MRYTYQYKAYIDAPIATWLSKSTSGGGGAFLINILMSLPFFIIGALGYNGNGHNFNAFNGIVLFLALVFFVFGFLILRAVNKASGLFDSIAKWERKRKS